MFDVYFSEIGLPNCELQEGEHIDIMQTLNDGPNHFNYISGGSEDNYRTIEGQDYDFKTEYSNHDGNGTDASCGQFAYLIYRAI